MLVVLKLKCKQVRTFKLRFQCQHSKGVNQKLRLAQQCKAQPTVNMSRTTRAIFQIAYVIEFTCDLPGHHFHKFVWNPVEAYMLF